MTNAIKQAAPKERVTCPADQQLDLNLEDSVEVNHAKFGDRFAEFTAITGGKDGE